MAKEFKMKFVIMSLKNYARELDLALLRARMFCDEIIHLAYSLIFEPTGWKDISPFYQSLYLATDDKGLLKFYDATKNTYISSFEKFCSPECTWHLAFRLIELINDSTLKIRGMK
jgi:hypothetical protein